ncbi:MAG: hypothetical protein JJT94_03995 [Bernardetiaceae bacterium]|nr:hypothetical protein [Bernardetiaceae bacterium]
MPKIFSFVLLLSLLSCVEKKGRDYYDNQISAFLEYHSIASNKNIYYVFEVFGFTDACYHYRVLCKIDSLSNNKIENELPMDIDAVNSINQIGEKFDKITSNAYINLNYQTIHKDVQLDYYNYRLKPDSIQYYKNTLKVNKKGYYKILNNQDNEPEGFIVYLSNINLLYIEYHSCNPPEWFIY